MARRGEVGAGRVSHVPRRVLYGSEAIPLHPRVAPAPHTADPPGSQPTEPSNRGTKTPLAGQHRSATDAVVVATGNEALPPHTHTHTFTYQARQPLPSLSTVPGRVNS